MWDIWKWKSFEGLKTMLWRNPGGNFILCTENWEIANINYIGRHHHFNTGFDPKKFLQQRLERSSFGLERIYQSLPLSIPRPYGQISHIFLSFWEELIFWGGRGGLLFREISKDRKVRLPKSERFSPVVHSPLPKSLKPLAAAQFGGEELLFPGKIKSFWFWGRATLMEGLLLRASTDIWEKCQISCKNVI